MTTRRFYRTVDDLRRAAPASPWLEQALLSAANLHLVHHEYDQALDAFREAQQALSRWPARILCALESGLASRCARDATRMRKKLSRNRLRSNPSGAETPAALYWRARLAEEDNQFVMARAFYEKLSESLSQFLLCGVGPGSG